MKLAKVVLMSLIATAGISCVAIGMDPLLIVIGYAIVTIIIALVMIINKDLTNGLVIWFLCALFVDGLSKIDLPSLPEVTPERIIWLLLLIIFIAKISLGNIKLKPITVIEWLFVVFCILSLISMVKGGTLYNKEKGLVLRNILNAFVIPFSILFITKNVIGDINKAKKLIIFFIIIGIYLAVIGIFEHYQFYSLIFPKYIADINYGIHLGRARGPFGNAAVNGLVLSMCLFLSIWYLKHVVNKYVKFMLLVSMVISLLAIYFTFTRSAWLSLLVASLIVYKYFPRCRKSYSIIFLFVIVLSIFKWGSFLTSDRLSGGVLIENPIYDRINLYGASIRMITEKPIFGFGLNSFQNESIKYFHKIPDIPFTGVGLIPHDTFIGVLVELGIVGMLIYLMIYLSIIKYSMKVYHSYAPDTDERDISILLWCLMSAYIVSSLFIDMRWFLFANSYIYAIVGVVISIEQRNS